MLDKVSSWLTPAGDPAEPDLDPLLAAAVLIDEDRLAFGSCLIMSGWTTKLRVRRTDPQPVDPASPICDLRGVRKVDADRLGRLDAEES